MTWKKLCPECYGWGTLPTNNETGEGFYECFKCHGTGVVDDAVQNEQTPMTNANRIRVMTDEELAAAFADAVYYGPSEKKCNDRSEAIQAWMDWLQKPVGGDGHADRNG